MVKIWQATAENLCSILTLVLCHLVMVLTTFSTGCTKWNTAAIRFFRYSWLVCLLRFWLRNSLKLLGVVLDNKLNFSKHVKLMCPEATSRIGTLTRMRKLVTEKTKLLLSKSVILSGLNYCSTVRFFITASDKRKLKRMQEKGLRAVFNDNTSSYESLLKKATLPTLCNRRLQVLTILMLKVKNGMSPDYISDLFQRSNTN